MLCRKINVDFFKKGLFWNKNQQNGRIQNIEKDV
jgi:hypothetical protein